MTELLDEGSETGTKRVGEQTKAGEQPQMRRHTPAYPTHNGPLPVGCPQHRHFSGHVKRESRERKSIVGLKTQAQAARLLGITQPRVSNLMAGNINLFSIDTLVKLLARAGLRVEVRVRKAA